MRVFTFFKNVMDGSPGKESMRLWVESGICPTVVSTGAVTYRTLLFPAYENIVTIITKKNVLKK